MLAIPYIIPTALSLSIATGIVFVFVIKASMTSFVSAEFIAKVHSIFIVFIHLFKVGKFSNAGRTPGCPIIDKDGFVKILQKSKFCSICHLKTKVESHGPFFFASVLTSCVVDGTSFCTSASTFLIVQQPLLIFSSFFAQLVKTKLMRIKKQSSVLVFFCHSNSFKILYYYLFFLKKLIASVGQTEMHSPQRIHSLSFTSWTSSLQKLMHFLQLIHFAVSTRTPKSAYLLKNE